MTLTARPLNSSDPELTSRLDAAGLSTSDLAAAGQVFFAFDHDGRSIGCGGFLLADEQALLRSIVIDEPARGNGFGSALVQSLADQAKKSGARNAWLLTTDAGAFFARQGFADAARSDAPPAIAGTPQFSGICPGSAAFMRRTLSGPA